MKVYVSVDIEGISGVVHADMMMPGQYEYARGRALMIGDANAAVEGAVQAGADYILVSDGHGPMRNLQIEHLHPAAHLVTGTADAKDYCQLEGAETETFDAAVFVGYHAMAKTFKAIHPHTIAGACVYELRVNGRPHGETGLNAFVLASLGIPTVAVTGDVTTCGEAKSFLGDNIETVAVKSATGRNAAICRPPAATAPEITEAVKRALGNISAVPLYKAEGPATIEIDFVTMVQCERAHRTQGVERVGPMTTSILGETPWEQYKNAWAAIRSALYEPASFLA
ncbi:MAG TPA: M55 family metallopeptidase [Thermomicrobiales bacterium]|nr:M55 family metallopeptidase [Thermomicrobiales bacterium]